MLFTYFLQYTIVYRGVATLNKLVEHKLYVLTADNLTVLLEYINLRARLTFWECLGPVMPEFGHTTECYTHVSTILKVLSFTFNTTNIVGLQVLVTCACRQTLVYNNA